MSWPELHLTLTALVQSLDPPVDSTLRIDHVEIEMPLEMMAKAGLSGPVVFARPPHSRWVAGILPQVHTGRLIIETSAGGPSLEEST